MDHDEIEKRLMEALKDVPPEELEQWMEEQRTTLTARVPQVPDHYHPHHYGTTPGQGLLGAMGQANTTTAAPQPPVQFVGMMKKSVPLGPAPSHQTQAPVGPVAIVGACARCGSPFYGPSPQPALLMPQPLVSKMMGALREQGPDALVRTCRCFQAWWERQFNQNLVDLSLAPVPEEPIPQEIDDRKAQLLESLAKCSVRDLEKLVMITGADALQKAVDQGDPEP